MPVQVGAVTFSDQEVEEFREVFELVDVDKGGTIEADEVMDLMELLGIETSREQVEKLINEIDEDGNGEIDFDEFLQVMAAGQNLPYSKKQMVKNFTTFAKKGTAPGFIHMDELRAAMQMSSLKPDDEEVDTLIKTMQPDDKGMINFQDKLNLYLRDDDDES